MTTIVTRSGKGSPLTHTEVDTNFTNLNTAKLETAAIPLGTLQAPSVSFLNDSDTGIFCPQGGNSLAIATGGQYAITCTSTQAVGIQTANPNAALHVAGNARVGADDVTDAVLEIGAGASGNRTSYIDIVADTTYTDYGLRVIRNNTGANATSELKHRGTGALNFTTEEAAPIVFYTTNSPALTILAGGNVGIGTSSPGQKLDVNGEIVCSPNTAGRNTFQFTTNAADDASLIMKSNTTTKVNIQANGTSYFNGGNVGIGTSSPLAKLEITTGTTDSLRITEGAHDGSGSTFSYPALSYWARTSNAGRTGDPLANPGGATAAIVFTDRPGTATYVENLRSSDIQFYTATNSSTSFASTNPAARMTITAEGRVGIGTTTVSSNLHIKPTTGDDSVFTNGLRVERNDTSGQYGLFNYAGGAASITAVETTASNPVVRFLRSTNGSTTTETARFDASGRLLVGTTSARSLGSFSSALQVESTSFSGSSISITNNENTANGAFLNFGKSRGASIGSNTVVNSGDNIAHMLFYGANGSGTTAAAVIDVQVEGTVGANRMPGRLVFSTATDASPSVVTERMRIHNDGRISTGTTSAPGAASFGFSINRTGSQGLLECYRNVGNNAQTAIIGGSAGEAYIEGDGDLKNTNNSYGAISDQKLKENIVDASSQWVDIKTLQVRRYNFKEETGYNTHTQIGLVAQEVELVSPGLVNESPDCDEDGNDLGTVTKSVNYSVLYMKAVKALQEAMERIETLEQRLTAAGID